ncbi:MAG: beta-propeller domain-containing protein [Pseudomonadota bacterium]
MRKLVASSVLMALLASASAPIAAQAPQDLSVFQGKAGPTLRRFASAAAFARYLKTVRGGRGGYAPPMMVMEAPPSVSMPNAAPAIQQSAELRSSTNIAAIDAPASPANPEITNNQTVGVDEGGIVKQIGHFLVVLQDGRLFSIDLGTTPGAAMRLADRANVYRSPARAADWYDEMLVLGDRILVTAYNYQERASEITVLRLSPDGKISREGRYLMSSNDYYSTENYASRLVGDNLVFYAPFSLDDYDNIARFEWPRLRRADGDGEPDKGKALIRATDVYAPPGKVEYPVLHTVSVCPLTTGMDCRTTAFVGPEMREFYVSPADAFLWIGAPEGLPWSIDYGNRRRTNCPKNLYWRDGSEESAMLYRLPLNGAAIGAVAVDGTPADQFAFDSKDGRFRALLARTEEGCSNHGEVSPLALLDIPLSAFGATLRHVRASAYTPLPPIEGGQLENRFVGDWLIYGGRDSWDSSAPPDGRKALGSSLFTVPLADPRGVKRLQLPHNAIRIERAGNDAVVTGYRNSDGLSLSYVGLGRSPRVASTTLLRNRFESEGRSHAFNAWVRGDGSGVMGIPTTLREWRSGRGWSDSASSDLSFIAIGTDKALASAGELAVKGKTAAPGYKCEVSCIDWYGNSRPIFTGGRIFALMGTELVEGAMQDGRIAERGRVDLTARLK